ncbi:MAG: hypothetical protein K6D97_08885, partial [Clostridia bacterium]|nr:hypothetical protein [Clostridia bacterium]
ITSEDIPDLNLVHFYISGDDYAIDEDDRFYLNEDVLNDGFVGIPFNQMRDLGAPRRVEFTGDNIVINGNTITMDNLLPYGTGTMSFTVYNADHTPTTPEFYVKDNPDFDSQQEVGPENPQHIPDTRKAFTRLNTNTFEDSYMEVTVSEGTLEGISFCIFGEFLYIDEETEQTGIVELRDLERSDGIDINEWRVTNGDKEINVTADHTSINGNAVTFDSPIEDNPGRITMAFYNSDGTTPVIKPYTNWNEEPEDTGCTIFLNSKDYEGVYATVTGDNTFDLDNIKFNFDGDDYLLQTVEQERRVYFPTELEPDQNYPDIPRNIQLSEWSIKPLYEKRTVRVEGDNLSVNENAITIDSPIENNPGRITMAFYNSDGSPATARAEEYWDDELQENVLSDTDGKVRFNATTYEGTYMVVTSTSNPAVDLSKVKFVLGGRTIYADEQTGRVYFPEAEEDEFYYLSDWSIQEAIQRMSVWDEEGITIEGNTVTLNSRIPGNEGELTFAFYNSDGTAATIERGQDWSNELQQYFPSETNADVKFNSKTYAGAYFIVTSNTVDLTDVKFDFDGAEYEMDANHKVTLTADLDERWEVGLNEYTIQEVDTRKEAYIENIHTTYNANTGARTYLNDDGTVTIDCNVENNEGTLKIGAYNADGTQVPLRLDQGWSPDPEEEPPFVAWGKFKTSTFEGTYYTVESDDVDLTKIVFAFGNTEVGVDDDGRVYIPEMERFQAPINDDNISNKEKNSVTVNATATGGYLDEITINNTQFIEDREPGSDEMISELNKTCDIEARTNDAIRIGVEYGYLINTLKINGKTLIADGEDSEYSGEIPHVDTYNIEITCVKDEHIPAYLCWSKTDKPYGAHCIVENGNIEVVSVTLSDGTTYDADEMMLHDDPGMGVHYRHEREATLWYDYDEDDNIVAGSVGVQRGTTVTVKLTPDNGFQVANSVVTTNGVVVNLTPTENPDEYTFVMPENMDPLEDDILFAGVFTIAYPDGLNKIDGVWYYYRENQVQTNFTGLVEKDGTWYYVQKGKLIWGVETLVKRNGTWYYVKNSMVDFNYTGLVQKDGIWYYVQKGKLVWGVESLVKRNSTWYYVKNSMVDFNYTGLVQKDGIWYYVQKGKLVWGVESLVKRNGTWYYVKNSMVDWSFTGL